MRQHRRAAHSTIADPDSDGISNLLEYAYALDPLFPSVLPVSVTNSPATCSLSYLRARSDINYTVETSATLAPNSWTTNEVTQDTTTPVGSTATATVIIDPTTNPQRFLRLKVSD